MMVGSLFSKRPRVTGSNCICSCFSSFAVFGFPLLFGAGVDWGAAGTGIGGAIAAAVAYGFIQVIGAILSPTLAVMAPYLMLFFVLLWRPQGLGRGRVA